MDERLAAAQRVAERIVKNVEQVIVGKPLAVELSVIALLSQGHLLIEDAPGVGKTMLARSLARSVNCTFKRIQFTPDMLPSDITGVSVFNQKTGDFVFRPGPIMAQIVLADEINRATPRVQSALLECMGERQITIDGLTYDMPAPFHILATENPIEYEGTFPLPETQLDRFLLRISLGYPLPSDEIMIMEKQQFKHPIDSLKPVADASDLLTMQEAVRDVYVDSLVYLGSSPRGSLALFRAAQARALMHGRDYTLPDDIKAVAEAVLAHRLVIYSTDGTKDRSGRSSIAEILERVPVPGAIP
jgi:MoxR-like ATPase